MVKRTVKSVTAAVENAADDVKGVVDQTVKDGTAAATRAVGNATAAVENAASALGGEVQNLVQTFSDSMNDGDEGESESSIVAFFRRIPKKAWFLMGLGVAGIIFVHRGGNVGELIAKGRKRFNRRVHPSICTYVKLQPKAFNLEDALKNRKFCAQDIFDVKTKVTSFGNPEWEKTHEKATKTAAVLRVLTKGGATCIGKTVMDDLGFSAWSLLHDTVLRMSILMFLAVAESSRGRIAFRILIGTNHWLGTPKNPFSTSRICGGSSSGAAVSVGSNVVDFAIVEFEAAGIDTVGDVRVPAACCGVFGFRSSHGAVSLESTIPVASSCDALGWFARDAGLLRLVDQQVCPHLVMDGRGPRRFYMANDVFKLSSVSHLRTGDVLARSVQRTIGRHTLHNLNLLDYLEHYVPTISTFRKELDRMGILASQYTALDVLRDSMILFQRHEFKGNHGQWIVQTKPHLPRTVETRVQKAVFCPNPEALRFIAVQVREEMRKVMSTLLKNDAVLVVPALPSVPPKLAAAPDELELFEYRTHALMSIATMSGCCQVVIPVGRDGVPMSVSLLARKGADQLLLETVVLLHTTIQQEILVITNPNLPITAFLEIK